MNAGLLHSSVLIFYFVGLMLFVMTFSSPLYLIAIFLVSIVSIWQQKNLNAFLNLALVFVPLSIVIILVNLLVSQNGENIIYKIPNIPLFGTIFFTYESLIYALVMGVKLCLMMTLVFWYDTWVGAERSFFFFSKIIPRSSFLVTWTAFLIPQMRRKICEANLVFKSRGLCYKASFFTRIKNVAPLIKVILLSALEDSWARAEALAFRAYGTGDRTSYFIEKWKLNDMLAICFILMAFGLCLYAVIYLGAYSEFYPIVNIRFNMQDIIVLSLITILLLVPVQLEG